MRWSVNAERTLYHDQWVHLRTADVSLPDGRRLDHRLIRIADGAHAVVVDQGRVLLMWRHRFITDTWGWEIPGGAVAPGETPRRAAARETEEETGWRPLPPLRPLIAFRPMAGLLTVQHHVFHAGTARHIGPPTHGWESERIAWLPLERLPALIATGDINEGTTLVALLRVLGPVPVD